jgi:hypothetical protein
MRLLLKFEMLFANRKIAGVDKNHSSLVPSSGTAIGDCTIDRPKEIALQSSV